MRIVLKSKITTTVKDCNLNYEGSITIDSDLMKRADILPYEQVHILNLNTGVRFETYALEGKGICMNGPAARLAVIGDPIVILSYVVEDRICLVREPIIIKG